MRRAVRRRKALTKALRGVSCTYQEAGAALGVSGGSTYRYVNPDKVTASFRKTTLGTTINGKHVLLAGLHKRDYSGKCELCGRVPKGRQKLGYHHWLDDFPSIGMWLCYACHMFVEKLEKGQALVDKYLKLKVLISVECITKEADELEYLNYSRSLPYYTSCARGSS